MVTFVNVDLKHIPIFFFFKKGTSLIITRQISSGWYNEHQQTSAKATGSHANFLAVGVHHVGYLTAEMKITQVDALTASHGAT